LPCLQKRAALLASGHVSTGQVPSIEEVNAAENILLPPSACQPRVVYGCSLDEAVPSIPSGSTSSGTDSSHSSFNGANGSSTGSSPSGDSSSRSQQRQQQELAGIVQLYAGEQYLLTWHNGTAWVLLLEGAGQLDMLRAMWQAAWLEQHGGQWLQQQQYSEAAAPLSAASSNGNTNGSLNGSSNGSSGGAGTLPAAAAGGAQQLLAASLAALHRQWPDFEQKAREQGWQLKKAVFPQGQARLRLE